MIITILTLFPEIFNPIFSSSILGRAQKSKLVEIKLVNIRDFAPDKHHQVDDKPYGGGVGMIMRVDVVERAISATKSKEQRAMSKFKERIVLLDPKGEQFNQKIARNFSKLDHLILVCGHYEGIDDRISNFVDEKMSIGDYILTGGEIPAMVITDATVRLIENVLSKSEAVINESFTKDNILESPQYTRPFEYKGFAVPSVLLSGNHQKIRKWQEKHQELLK